MVLAVLGILIAIAAPNLRASSSRIAANSIQATVQQARFEAIKRNRPVVVDLDVSNGNLTLSATVDAGSVACDGVLLIRAVAIADFGRTSFAAENVPFVWLPNGQPRACGGGTIAGQPTFSVVDAKAAFTVSVTIGGEVGIK